MHLDPGIDALAEGEVPQVSELEAVEVENGGLALKGVEAIAEGPPHGSRRRGAPRRYLASSLAVNDDREQRWGESPKEDARGPTIDLPETLAECLNSLNCNEDSSARRRSPVRTRAPARILRPGGGVRGPPKPAASTARAPVGSRRDRSFARARSMRGARRPSPSNASCSARSTTVEADPIRRRRGPLEGPPRARSDGAPIPGLALAPRVGPRCRRSPEGARDRPGRSIQRLNGRWRASSARRACSRWAFERAPRSQWASARADRAPIATPVPSLGRRYA